jgi:3-deoxy-manno-octulosonate cytidylyltransferase (CMP-KDO synthetase)
MAAARDSSRERTALRALAIVPARLGSTRLPRKMLLAETGKPLFQHTVEGVRRSRRIQRVVLATDAEEIQRAARELGVDAVLTAREHASGTDRVNEALAQLVAAGHGPWDVVLNVQGDEPEIRGETLEPLIAAFADDAVEMATLATPLVDPAEALDASVVKVVLDRSGNALYFSRAPIPGQSPAARGRAPGPYLRHIGVYAFRPDALRAFCALPRGRLEELESLEQLRWLESGRRIRVLESSEGSVGIDTAEQYARFVERERTRSHQEVR